MKADEIAFLTATGDRPTSFELCIKWMLEQDYPGEIHWVVVDDGFSKDTEDVLNRSSFDKRFRVQLVKRVQGSDEAGPRSMAQNILVGSAEIKENLILIIEDDDWYHPRYVSDMVERLQRVEAAGTVWQNYYYLPKLTYNTYRNKGSALCSTGLQRQLLPFLRRAAQWSFERNSKGLDARFWTTIQQMGRSIEIFDNVKQHLMIGMKGLPGRRGIGVGHEPERHSRWKRDIGFKVLRNWVGPEATKIYQLMRRDYNLAATE